MNYSFTFLFLALGLYSFSQERLDLELPHNKRGYTLIWSEQYAFDHPPEHVLNLDARQAKNLDSLIKRLPEFKNIESLNLWGLGLDSLPDFFKSFPHLRYINIAKNNLTGIPASFNTLKHLKRVELSGNPIGKLPEVLYHSELTLLDIQAIELKGTFVISENWKNLEFLAIAHNPIDSIYGVRNLKKLETLYATKCNLSFLPEDWRGCRKLEILYIDFNPILDLPKSLLRRNRLRYILLEGTQIPDETLYKYRVRFPTIAFDECPTC
jgi:Leucine-rich repeat (LRR) protein